jgi:lipopolysaccharide transport system ATP-binding protein
MCSSDTAIIVRSVGKRYQIYHHPQDRLKQSVIPRLRSLLRLSSKNYFREFEALKNVTFVVKKGETVGIVGSNGSGKSTLLQIICGTLSPSTGEVITSGQIAALLELGTGFNPEFTGIENIYLYGHVLGLKSEQIKQLIPTILEFADIGEFVYQPVKAYSSGMVVRLAFAVSVIREPDILVVDEALAVGDEAFQRKCFTRIEDLKKRGSTILFVSHGANIVVSICDRALLLDQGELLYEGTPKDTISLYHKLAFAPTQSRQAIRWEILNAASPKHEQLTEKSEKMKADQPAYSAKIKSFFVPHFKSKSQLLYEEQGVKIENPCLMTLSGEQVNHLIHGEEYIYTYSIKFLQSAHNVRFGMLIKTINGVELSGSVFPSIDKGVEHVEQGTETQISFQFKCLLNTGSYFLNAGVTGVRDGTTIYLHRIIDALIFRVLPLEEPKVVGYVSLGIKVSLQPALFSENA